ncbi:MAG: hypothetical protein EOO89_25545 [Pedobacter sp.]|nr:MAG: hypothetical protein EOO89_25545 [Pedobacter sp.]
MSNQNQITTGIIKFSDIADLPLDDAITAIRTSSRIRYGDIKISDLLLNGSITHLKLSDFSLASNYGIGVYVFFDGDVPVYAGKADNFLHRLSSHRSIDPRPNWGWNALLQKICATRMNIVKDHTRENLEGALAIVEAFGVVRIVLDTDAAKQKLSRFERVIMKGIKHQSDTLLNGGIGRLPDNFILQPIKNLMQ